MTQDINNANHYTAEEGMVFRRINNGFGEIKPIILGKELYLGKILIDGEGNALKTPIDDKIEYYDEVAKPERKPRKFDKEELNAMPINETEVEPEVAEEEPVIEPNTEEIEENAEENA